MKYWIRGFQILNPTIEIDVNVSNVTKDEQRRRNILMSNDAK